MCTHFNRPNSHLICPQGEEGSGTVTPTTGVADDLDFSDIKKKKKKKKAAFDLEAFEKELSQSKAKDEEVDVDEAGGEPDGRHLDDVNEEDLGEDVFAQAHEAPAGADTQSEPWLSSDRDYTYQEVSTRTHTGFCCTYLIGQLLKRFYSQLHASNPALFSSSTKRYTIAPPQIMREGNKKSIFANIPDICKRMHRQPEHVIQFMFAEMGTTGSVDGSGRLVIKGRFQQKQIENVLRRYIGTVSHFTPYLPLTRADLHHSIVEYVTCKTCKSFDTLLTKENRIFFMSCMSCGSRRSVSAIKSGFQAQVGKRIKK